MQVNSNIYILYWGKENHIKSKNIFFFLFPSCLFQHGALVSIEKLTRFLIMRETLRWGPTPKQESVKERERDRPNWEAGTGVQLHCITVWISYGDHEWALGCRRGLEAPCWPLSRPPGWKYNIYNYRHAIGGNVKWKWLLMCHLS